MFQDGSDGVPTDSPLTLGCRWLRERTRPYGTRNADALLTSLSGSTHPVGLAARALPRGGGRHGGYSSAPQPASTTLVYKSAPGTSPGVVPSEGASGGRRAGRGALPAESAPGQGTLRLRQRWAMIPSSSPAAACPRAPAESHGSTLWSHPFASMRFHVLLNSLFKVLFNFPSRYLFAIGLVQVFSLRWSLPPTLGCIPKQPDSGDQDTRDSGRASYGPITRYG